MIPLNGNHTKPPLAYVNESGEKIPKFGVLKITEVESTDDRDLRADKPDGAADNCTFALNLDRAVASGREGVATNDYASWALYDHNGGSDTPQPGEQWGPSTDWLLHKGKTGYRIVGGAESFTIGATTYRRVRVQTTDAPTFSVYQFNNCTDPARKLYLDNTDIGDHDPGEVAVIKIDGVLDCWRLYGPAPQCKTGSCAEIIAWGADCDACSVCFYLTPCGGGSPTFVRGVEWYQYVGRVVKLDGPGHEGCYTVAVATGCYDVNEALGVEHITDDYANCDGCGCYELENCDDEEDVIYVSGDLATVVGQTSGVDSIGERVKRRGVCYTITAFANPCGTEPEVWDIDEVERIESCSACCYLLTPCEGQADDPEPFYLKLKSSDDVNPEDFLDGDASNGRAIMLAGYVCYTWSVPETCPEEDVVIGIPTVLEEYDSCEDCKITCWKECDVDNWIRTYSDMSDVGPGAVAKRAEDDKCYFRVDPPTEDCDGEAVPFTIEAIFDEGLLSCDICQDPKVKLTPSCGVCPDCEGGTTGTSITDEIITDDATLFPHVGKYVKVDGQCYLVEWTTEEVTEEDVCFTGPYNSCAECDDAPTRLIVLARRGDVHKEVTIYGHFNICEESSLSECE